MVFKNNKEIHSKKNHKSYIQDITLMQRNGHNLIVTGSKHGLKIFKIE